MIALLTLLAAQAAAPMQASPPMAGRAGMAIQSGDARLRSDPPLPQAATASPPPSVMVGMPVVNPNGNAVGRIVAADGSRVVIDTGAQRMSYPSTRFSASGGSAVFDLTQAQVDTEALGAQGDARARLMTMVIPGAAVRDPGGTLIGTVEGVGSGGVTVSGGSTKTAVPISAFSVDATGGLVIPVSAAEFSAPR
jgi:hypothetical protein